MNHKNKEVNYISSDKGHISTFCIDKARQHIDFQHNKSVLTERLKAVIGLFRSQSDMAEKIEVSLSGIKGWLRGVEPGFLKIRKIVEVTGLSYEWLALGIAKNSTDFDVELLRLKLHCNEAPTPQGAEEMRALVHVEEELKKEIDHRRRDADGPISETEDTSVEIPRYDVHLSAGAGHWNEDNVSLLDYIPFTPDFLRKKLDKTTVRDLLILEGKGDSMWPTISDGDLMLIDKSDTKRVDGIFAYVQDGLARVKRFRFMAHGKIEIVSDNRELYASEIISNGDMMDMHIIGRVRWIGHTV